ncbi:hypothetical protein RRG08_058494 [Elysia crispata]|uniref:Uncharacterized protein n=1 Tax=Elysia crispata TaxID=231223 RepID=A0AAE0Y780_9GAST|nr:hypothetical protein RRG08_058494 [Elysia crispata]
MNREPWKSEPLLPWGDPPSDRWTGLTRELGNAFDGVNFPGLSQSSIAFNTHLTLGGPDMESPERQVSAHLRTAAEGLTQQTQQSRIESKNRRGVAKSREV